MFLFIVNARI